MTSISSAASSPARGATDEGRERAAHGRPGTGKTELARAVAAQTAEQLYEVNVADHDGDPIESKQRLS